MPAGSVAGGSQKSTRTAASARSVRSGASASGSHRSTAGSRARKALEDAEAEAEARELQVSHARLEAEVLKADIFDLEARITLLQAELPELVQTEGETANQLVRKNNRLVELEAENEHLSGQCAVPCQLSPAVVTV